MSLVDLESAKRFTSDLLLTYLVNPGTAVHLGVSNSYENLDFDPTRNADAAPNLIAEHINWAATVYKDELLIGLLGSHMPDQSIPI